jgi:hypothetical protein
LRTVPAWWWLAGIVVASFLLRAWLARGMVAPFIMVDELIYSELAKSLAASGSFAIRGVPESGYSVLYPALIAPAYAIFRSVPDAYDAAKIIDSLAMSLAAVPAYLLTRRIAGAGLSLLVAVLTVAVPSMAYTGTLTTESVFYPLALTVALLLARYLETPSWKRLAPVLLALALAYETRSQGLVFVAVLATAPLALAGLRLDARLLRPFTPMYALLVAGAAVAFVVQRARGRSLSDLLGAYSIVGHGHYDAKLVAHFWLWHIEELTLYAAIVPVAALLVLLARGRRLPARLQEHLAVTVASVVCGTLVVAAFASRFASDRVQDRYLFYLVPLLLAGIAGWIAVGSPRPRATAPAAAAIAVGLALLFPYGRFVGLPATSDTLGLIPLWTINAHLPFGSYQALVALVGLALAALFLLVPARAAVAVLVVILGLFVAESRAVWSGPHGFLTASKGALFQGLQSGDRTWIDDALPKGTTAAILWAGPPVDRLTVNENEFFNRSVGPVYYIGAPTPGGLPETQVRLGADRVLRFLDGRPVRARAIVLDGRFDPDARLLARDPGTGLTLWRVNGPVTVPNIVIHGLYPNDSWSGPKVVYREQPCRAGTLAVSLGSDPALFKRPTTVVARSRGRVLGSIRIPPSAPRRILTLPLRPSHGVCTIVFDVTPTAVPSRVLPQSTDDRTLGAHFYGFARQR